MAIELDDMRSENALLHDWMASLYANHITSITNGMEEDPNVKQSQISTTSSKSVNGDGDTANVVDLTGGGDSSPDTNSDAGHMQVMWRL